MNTNESSKPGGKKTHISGLGLAIATAIGVSLGVLFAPRKGTDTQKDILEKGKELASKFTTTRQEINQALKKIFGNVSKELEENYLELQGNILAEVDDIQDRASLTKKKYDEIVKGAVEQFSEGKKWTGKNIQALTKQLQKDWK